MRGVMQPLVVGSLIVHASGEKPPWALRGAGAATGDLATTKPWVRLSPPTNWSALSADSFCFFICSRLTCWALTSASSAAFLALTTSIA
jgi:hypothetical protein